MPNWKNPHAQQKLMAAFLASLSVKPNYNEIARLFGEGATYDSIEGQFRAVRKLAQSLKEGRDDGTTAPLAVTPSRSGNTSRVKKATVTRGPRPSKSTPASRVPKGNAVLDGHISKSKSKSLTPTQKAVQQQLDLVNQSIDEEHAKAYGTPHPSQSQGSSFNSLYGYRNENMVMGVKEEVVSSESSVMGDTAGGMHDYSMYSTPEMESFLSEYSAMEDEGPTEV